MSEQLKNTIIRFAFVFFAITAGFVGVIAKILYIQVAEQEKWDAIAQKQVKRVCAIQPIRGNIYDNDGRLLASSTPQYYIWMDTRVEALHLGGDTLFNRYIGAISEGQRSDIIKRSDIYGKYDEMVDRESAYEQLLKENEAAQKEAEQIAVEEEKAKGKEKPGMMSKVMKAIMTAITGTLATILGTWVSNKVTGKKTKSSTSATGRVVKNATSAATRSITKELTRDILGNLVK